MKNTVKFAAILLLLSMVLFSCGSPENDLPVSDLSISGVTRTTSSDTSKPPIAYTATVSWNIADIQANEVASAALIGFEAYMNYGSEDELQAELGTDATSYTFTGLEPGDSCWLEIRVVYDENALPDADSTNISDSVKFIGGPWFTGTSSTVPENVSRFSVGSFNNLNSMPTGTYSLDDVYYYNEYNTEYQFDSVGETVWMLVETDEVTETNNTTTQRDNVMWLNNDFQLLDRATSGLTSYDDIAGVDITILDIYGNTLLSITGSTTEAAMSSSNFSNLLSSVDSGYYADKTGYYFIKAKCTSMPVSYSSSNTDHLGIWGFANNGPRR